VSRTNADYLHDLLRELEDISAFTAEGKLAFVADVKTQKAVIRSYEVIRVACVFLRIGGLGIHR
jgi:uncharacterized protein with HEPN domain